jgi:hypothetical protein
MKKKQKPKTKIATPPSRTPARGPSIPINRRVKNEPREPLPTKRTILTRVRDPEDIARTDD